VKEIPYIQIRAKSNYHAGFQIGKLLANQIRRRLNINKKMYKKLMPHDFGQLKKIAVRFLPETMNFFPLLVEEARGMSDGSGVPFDDLMVLICEEELLDIKIHKCTSVAVRNDKEILVGHNEDWLASYRKNGVYILHCQFKEIEFLSLNYMGTLAGSSCGLNSYGLCFTGNSLNSGKFRYGVPKNFQMRAILSSSTVPNAVKADLSASSINSNMLYASKNARILDVEDLFYHDDFFYGKEFLIHTNHPLLEKERNDMNTDRESIRRYKCVESILIHDKNRNLGTIRKILRNHETGICGHASRKHSGYGVTIASVIMNPQKKWMEVAWTNPCKHNYVRYRL